jgi:hypothetical protein
LKLGLSVYCTSADTSGLPGLARGLEEGRAGAAATGQLCPGVGAGDARLRQDQRCAVPRPPVGSRFSPRSAACPEACRPPSRPGATCPRRSAFPGPAPSRCWNCPELMRPGLLALDADISGAGVKPWSAVSTAR